MENETVRSRKESESHSEAHRRLYGKTHSLETQANAEDVRVERQIAMLKALRPEMCGITDGDLDRLAEVFEG